MGNDPLTVKRNRGADREDLTWTRGRTILQHTDRRKNGQPGLLAGPGLGCMSAFAGYAHGSKSSIGEPGDSVLECGGRGALENGVPSREGQIMDGTTIELTEKLERLLREAAQVSVDLDRAKGTIVGVPHYSVIEARAHELGQQLSRQIQLRRMGEISAQASSSAKCPACGTGCELGRKKRRVTSIDGPLVVEEPVGHCPRWSSGL